MTPCIKIPYRSQDEAERARKALNLVPWYGAETQPAYLCGKCGHWHLTTGESRGKKKRGGLPDYAFGEHERNPFDRKPGRRRPKFKPKRG